jgi:hypothetical protein
MALCGGRSRRPASVAWRLLEQQSEQRALLLPQQEQPEQQEQQQRFSSGGLPHLPVFTGNAGRLWLDGRGKKDGATGSLAESRMIRCGPGEYRTGPAPGRCALGRATYKVKPQINEKSSIGVKILSWRYQNDETG